VTKPRSNQLLEPARSVQAAAIRPPEGALGVPPPGNVLSTQAEPAEPAPSKRPAHYLWAVLIARILRLCGTDRSDAQRTSSVLN